MDFYFCSVLLQCSNVLFLAGVYIESSERCRLCAQEEAIALILVNFSTFCVLLFFFVFIPRCPEIPQTGALG